MSRREKHPYGTFLPAHPLMMIIGSFPIGKFSDPKRRCEIKEHEIDFFFGGEKNLLWRLLGDVFNQPVKNHKDIVALLESQGIAMGDVIKSCRRKSGGASDSDLYDIEWNEELLESIRNNRIKKVLFTSKKVEQWFNKLFPASTEIEKITLISPSGQSVRSLAKRADYLEWRNRNSEESNYEFILENYRARLLTGS